MESRAGLRHPVPRGNSGPFPPARGYAELVFARHEPCRADTVRTMPSPASAEPGRPDEKRGVPRRHVLKSAKVVYNGGHSVLDCRLQDISETGARIRLPTPVVLPDEFNLHLSDGSKPRVEVVWRTAVMLGVRFLDRRRRGGRAGRPPASSALLDRISEIEELLSELRDEIAGRLGK